MNLFSGEFCPGGPFDLEEFIGQIVDLAIQPIDFQGGRLLGVLRLGLHVCNVLRLALGPVEVVLHLSEPLLGTAKLLYQLHPLLVGVP